MGAADGLADDVVEEVVQHGDGRRSDAPPRGPVARGPGGIGVTVEGGDVRHDSGGGGATTCGNHHRGGTDLVVVDLTRQVKLVHYGETNLHMDQRGPAPSRGPTSLMRVG